MDKFTLVILVVNVASIVIVGRLAREGGREPRPWVWTAAFIGPFAIPLLYLADAISALRKMLNAQRP
jgi:hypothetical protein